MQLQTVLGSQLAQEAERSNGAADGANEMREIADSVNDLSTAVLARRSPERSRPSGTRRGGAISTPRGTVRIRGSL